MSILEVSNVSKSFGGVKALTPPKDLLTLLTSKMLILILPVLFGQLHQQLHQIFLGIFLLTNP